MNTTANGIPGTKAFNGIHRIPIPIPFPLRSVNVYLVEGSPLSLIDTGLRTKETLDALREAFKRIGKRLEDLERIYITHGHIDHFGAARALSAVSGAKVFVHAFDLEKVEHRWLQLLEKEPSPLASYLAEAGAPPHFHSFLKEMFLSYLATYSEPLEGAEPLGDGDIVPCGDRMLETRHFPGHSLGEICFFEPEEKLLFSGDHLLPEITPNPLVELLARSETGYQSLETYLDSLESTRALEVRFVLPGHGEIFGPAEPRIADILVHHERRKEDILRILENGKKTMWEICARLFDHIEGREVFLGLSEVDGHLHLLEKAGKVRCEPSDGVLFFRKL